MPHRYKMDSLEQALAAERLRRTLKREQVDKLVSLTNNQSQFQALVDHKEKLEKQVKRDRISLVVYGALLVLVILSLAFATWVEYHK